MEENTVLMEFIRSKVPEDERLATLAEEATELAHAALKMRRTLVPNNPTPVDYASARAALWEEFADVVLSLTAVGYVEEDLQVLERNYQDKERRWAKRLASDNGQCGP